MARQWILTGQEGFEQSLKYQENLPVPSSADLGPNEVLVELRAASLNYREIVVPTPGLHGTIVPDVIAGSDGAGVVKAVGAAVEEFREEDRVITHLAPKLVASAGNDARPGWSDLAEMLGQKCDGVLRTHGVFSELALIHAPKTLGWLQSATLSCAWLTAWNSLFGLKGREPSPGAWVLIQGTGGVSIAALQLAVAAGASVVATTSSEDKAARLRSLGALHTVNYCSNPAWGEEARTFIPDNRGFDLVVDIGGDETVSQSLAAVRVEGVVAVVGVAGKSNEAVPLMAVLMNACIARGVLLGSRNQFRDLVRFIDEKGIEPAVDDVVFELAESKDAYRRLNEKKHFAKVLIRIDV